MQRTQAIKTPVSSVFFVGGVRERTAWVLIPLISTKRKKTCTGLLSLYALRNPYSTVNHALVCHAAVSEEAAQVKITLMLCCAGLICNITLAVRRQDERTGPPQPHVCTRNAQSVSSSLTTSSKITLCIQSVLW
jgi:hypothetical protein